jgi:hypothetical protein
VSFASTIHKKSNTPIYISKVSSRPNRQYGKVNGKSPDVMLNKKQIVENPFGAIKS